MEQQRNDNKGENMELPNGKMSVIVGGQAGSESKGKLSGWLCGKYQPDVLVMSASPNAGHTVVKESGEKKVSYHLPIGAVMCDARIVLGPASLINPLTFKKEVEDLGIDPSRITVDPRAAIITPWDIAEENVGKLSDIGSTLQGIGTCRISKIRRDGNSVRIADGSEETKELVGRGMTIAPTSRIVNDCLDADKIVLCESTQGFDLDLEHGIDPRYCTSKMINPAMAMAEAGVSPLRVGRIYGVVRPYPIRVNNRTGTSGPYAGAEEIAWEDVANRCNYPGNSEDFQEITTTTKLPRRVFEFSWERFEHFVRVCAPTNLCLQFANYIDWKTVGVTDSADLPNSVLSFISALESVGNVPVSFVGTGAGHNDMVEIGY